MDGRWCQHFPRSGGRKRRPSHTSTNTPDSVLHIGYFVSFRTVVQTEPLKHAVKNRRLYKQYLGMKVSALINPQNVLAAGWDENWNESRCYSAHCLGERPFNLLHTHTFCMVSVFYFLQIEYRWSGLCAHQIQRKWAWARSFNHSERVWLRSLSVQLKEFWRSLCAWRTLWMRHGLGISGSMREVWPLCGATQKGMTSVAVNPSERGVATSC